MVHIKIIKTISQVLTPYFKLKPLLADKMQCYATPWRLWRETGIKPKNLFHRSLNRL